MNNRDRKEYWLRSFEQDIYRVWIGAIGGPIMVIIGLAAIPWAGEDRKKSLALAGAGLAISLLSFGMLWWRARLRRELAEMPPEPVVHEVDVDEDESTYNAWCSCGWMGEDRKTREQALEEGRRHAAGEVVDPETEAAWKAAGPHDAHVFRDRDVYSAVCTCGWEGAETRELEASLSEARKHSGQDDVEVVDVGEPRDEVSENEAS